jgi:DNA-binding transcriptional ArsR family regulator
VLNHSATLDAVFASLADPTRRRMVERLTQRPYSVSELAEPLAMSLPAVMQHLAVLEAAGVVSSEKVGRVRTVKLAAKPLQVAEKWLGERRPAWERRFDRLADALNDPHNKEPKK